MDDEREVKVSCCFNKNCTICRGTNKATMRAKDVASPILNPRRSTGESRSSS